MHQDQPVNALDICSDADVQRVARWNRDLEHPIQQKCVHELIQQQRRQHPTAPAISAWDGGMTYAELDSLASRLAIELQRLGVGPEAFVALCFEKSKWAVTALLGVIKAGGAYVFLDPSHPPKLNQRICQSAAVQVVVCSPVHAALAENLADHMILLDNDFLTLLDAEPTNSGKQESISPSPHNALYAVFTSGSTGEPKGIVTEHAAFYSMALANGNGMGLSIKSRVLQFASYTFDVSNRDMLLTLMFGGCICIPSESDRINDITNFITRHNVTSASMTPSVADVIRFPSLVPCLQTLILGGEPMTAAHIDCWAEKVRLMNAYGVSESTGVSALASDIRLGHSPRNIGRGCGSKLWVVSMDNPHRLSPIGAVGELVIQGPALARHYLRDKERTERYFLHGADWQWRLHSDKHSRQRLYRTGDLVRYNLDGSIEYIGRKDDQVKLNGQRVELGDIQHHVAKCPALQNLATSNVAIVAVSMPASSTVRLVAFLNLEKELGQKGERQPTMVLAPVSVSGPQTEALKEYLSSILPNYMIPAHFVFAYGLPLTRSGKINLPELRRIAAELVLQNTTSSGDKASTGESFSGGSGDEARLPSSAHEDILGAFWAEVLNHTHSQFQRHDNFFARGGDSIGAMKLVAALRIKGFELCVADVFKHPTLSGMASALRQLPVNRSPVPTSIGSFALIADHPNLIDEVKQQLGLRRDEIEDVYPCTPLQEGLVALTNKAPGAMIARYRWRLPEGLDIGRFRTAWEMVWTMNPILRTQIVIVPYGAFQVVVRTEMPWETIIKEVIGFPAPDISLWGGPLVHFVLCLDSWELVLHLHHALFDGWSLCQTLQEVECAYHFGKIHPRPFNTFVKYALDQHNPASDEFWRAECSALEAENFPCPPSAISRHGRKMVLEHVLEIGHSTSMNYTISSLLRLAWAIVLWHRTGSEDVLFGTTLMGRNASLEGIDTVSGPTLATVPVRIKVPTGKSAKEGLNSVQEQFLRMIAYEQTGLQNIRQAGPGPATACEFQNLLIIHPQEQQLPNSSLFLKTQGEEYDNLKAFTTYPFMMVCTPDEESIVLQASFYTECVSPADAKQILAQMAHVYRQLMMSDMQIIDISLVTPANVTQLRQWNSDVPSSVHACIHELIQKRCCTQPDAVAVQSIDYALTYRKLDQFSTRFASRLAAVGVQRGDFVPLLFEKSIWMTVAMLAALKAGAAFVTMEPSYPFQRLREICTDVQAKVVVSSAACSATSSKLHNQVLVVSCSDVEGDTTEKMEARRGLLSVTPNDPAYIIFTSGSTGKPKGIIIHHSAISSSAHVHCSRLQLSPQSRVFQFASYAFDNCVSDNLFSLVAGACICVPSETDRRNNPTKAMADLQVNWAMLTPSVMTLIDPVGVPTLRTLIATGELLTTGVAQKWPKQVRLMNTYGPAECSVLSTLKANVDKDTNPGNIGIGTGAVCWVVDRNDHRRLLPIGAVGELLLEGPIVGAGYLNNPEKTAAAFIQSPHWLSDFRPPGYLGKLYKTGDLVSYCPDGSLEYHGRKDLQVKLNGQRLELGEVEHQIGTSSLSVREAITEVIRVKVSRLDDPCAGRLLVAFVCPHNTADWGSSTDSGPLAVIEDLQDRYYLDIANLVSQLRKRLPSYMIPSLFVPLSRMPLTLSGKLDRRSLHKQVSEWSREKLLCYQSSRRSSLDLVPCVTEKQKQIHHLVGEVLGLEVTSFGMESNFFSLGGDSVAAMRLGALARKERLRLMVADIFRSLTLSDMAEYLTTPTEHVNSSGPLLAPDAADNINPDHSVYRRVSCDILGNIEEVRRATQFQSMTLRAWYPRYLSISLPKSFDTARLSKACQLLVDRHPILRTVFIVDDGNQTLQIVMRTIDIHIKQCPSPNLATHVAEDSASMPVALEGNPPFQVQMVTMDNSQVFLILRLAHAQFDGLSIPVLCEDLSAGYNNHPLEPTTSFFSHLHESRVRGTDVAYLTWSRLLDGAQMTDLRLYKERHSTPSTDGPTGEESRKTTPQLVVATKTIPLVCPPFQITMATLVKAAWAITLMDCITSADQTDVVFGQVVHGRDLGIPHEERIVGPCLNIIPVRVKFTASVTDGAEKMALLRHVQEQHLETMPFENLDFSDLVRHCTPWPTGTTFGSFVRFQGIDIRPTCWLDGVPCETSLESLPNPPGNTANVLVVPHGSELSITMTISNETLDWQAADDLVRHFCDAIESLARL
jgi:amino acid adenylation domain-containing protein